jgi:dihydroorotase
MPATMARAIIMPNLKPPVVTTADALAYRSRILAALPPSSDFMPLMTLYLTDNTSPDEIDRAVESGVVFAVKLYPAGATTNSDAGVTSLARVDAVLARMAERGFPLLIHGEVTRPEVDVFEREAVFIEEIAGPLVARHPTLKVVLEHITTEEAATFVLKAGPNVAATVTAHHLLLNRNALFEGGLRPHRYCLPVLKHETHRRALVTAVTSGNPKFFLGTDSAPHAKGTKECACGAAGMFTAHAAVELYAQVFEAHGAMEHFRAFACENGPRFYGLPTNAERLPGSGVEVVREEWTVPETMNFGPSELVPYGAGGTIPLRARVVKVEAAAEAAPESK